MNSKAFYDNSRFVVVIEDCDEETKAKLAELLKFELVSDVEVEPTSNPLSVAKENEDVAALSDAINKKTVDDALCSKVATLITNKELNPEDEAKAREIIYSYLNRRFKSLNSEKYLEENNEKFMDRFVELFMFGMVKILERYQLFSVEDFKKASLNVKKEIILMTLKTYKAN